MRSFTAIAILLGILAGSVWFAYRVWNSVDFNAIPTSGYVAMAIGTVLSLLVGGGLMALLFYSSRQGYDEPHLRDPDDKE